MIPGKKPSVTIGFLREQGMPEKAPEEAVQGNEQMRRDKEMRVIMEIRQPRDLGNEMLGVCERAQSGRRKRGVRRGYRVQDTQCLGVGSMR